MSFLADLRDAPRYHCDCCGYRTLLNRSYCEICPVCGWEDDSILGRPRELDEHSGPNHISLREARANFARFGASTPSRRDRVRSPRADEQS